MKKTSKALSKKTIKEPIKFKIKRSNKYFFLLSKQENRMSDDVKAFRKIAHKMNIGDSIEVNTKQCRRINKFLSIRKLRSCFASRAISKRDDIIKFYCVKKISKAHIL